MEARNEEVIPQSNQWLGLLKRLGLLHWLGLLKRLGLLHWLGFERARL
jgi:hypothetical protein